MGIILLSGLSQAWLRVAVLDDPRELFFFSRQGEWAGGGGGGGGDPFTAPLADSKQEKSVLLGLGIYSPAIPSCTCLRALSFKEYFIFTSFTFAYHYKYYE